MCPESGRGRCGFKFCELRGGGRRRVYIRVISTPRADHDAGAPELRGV